MTIETPFLPLLASTDEVAMRLSILRHVERQRDESSVPVHSFTNSCSIPFHASRNLSSNKNMETTCCAASEEIEDMAFSKTGSDAWFKPDKTAIRTEYNHDILLLSSNGYDKKGNNSI